MTTEPHDGESGRRQAPPLAKIWVAASLFFAIVWGALWLTGGTPFQGFLSLGWFGLAIAYGVILYRRTRRTPPDRPRRP